MKDSCNNSTLGSRNLMRLSKSKNLKKKKKKKIDKWQKLL